MDKIKRNKRKIMSEEMTNSEVKSLIRNQIDSSMSSKEFEKKIKEITADVMNDLFKTLWQRNSFWKNNIKN